MVLRFLDSVGALVRKAAGRGTENKKAALTAVGMAARLGQPGALLQHHLLPICASAHMPKCRCKRCAAQVQGCVGVLRVAVFG